MCQQQVLFQQDHGRVQVQHADPLRGGKAVAKASMRPRNRETDDGVQIQGRDLDRNVSGRSSRAHAERREGRRPAWFQRKRRPEDRAQVEYDYSLLILYTCTSSIYMMTLILSCF